jgi:hypothetical protein
MPIDREYSARDAGEAIANAGLVDDVIPANERDISDRTSRKKAENRRNERSRREDIEDDSDDDGEDYDDEADSGSNRDDGESEDDGDEDYDDEDDSDEGEDGESRAQSKDKFEVTVNGEKLKVSRDELIQGYQRNEDYHRKTQGLAQERRSFVEAHTKVATSLQRAMQNTQGVLHQVLDVIAGSVDSPHMQHLRQTNPDQWTRERMAIQDQREKVAKILQDSLQEQERLRATSLQQNNQDQSALARATVEQMQKHVPDWLKPGKDGVTGAQRLLRYLVKDGFQEAEVKSVLDPRMLRIADKARRLDELLAKGGQAAEQHRKAKNPPPKPPKGRGSEIQRKASKETVRSKSYRQARAKAKQSGNMRDAGDAINKLFRFDR